MHRMNCGDCNQNGNFADVVSGIQRAPTLSHCLWRGYRSHTGCEMCHRAMQPPPGEHLNGSWISLNGTCRHFPSHTWVMAHPTIVTVHCKFSSSSQPPIYKIFRNSAKPPPPVHTFLGYKGQFKKCNLPRAGRVVTGFFIAVGVAVSSCPIYRHSSRFYRILRIR
jgi:hypothetical protein